MIAKRSAVVGGDPAAPLLLAQALACNLTFARSDIENMVRAPTLGDTGNMSPDGIMDGDLYSG